MDTNKLRNTAKFFAHLISHDALPWDTMSCITLTEKMTTSSGRIFIKILFQEMVTFLGIVQVQKIASNVVDHANDLSDPDEVFPVVNGGSTATVSPEIFVFVWWARIVQRRDRFPCGARTKE